MRSLDCQIRATCALFFLFSAAVRAGDGSVVTFKKPATGTLPLAPLTADSQGNLYGTTFAGGNQSGSGTSCNVIGGGCGLVFKLTPDGSGHWSYTVIYKFQGPPNDGEQPTDVLAIDSLGNIYGTTAYGGKGAGYTSGTVYELRPAAGGSYQEQVLYDFTGREDGGVPNGVILDAAGNLYGTTNSGGTSRSAGVVWKLSPASNPSWTFQILHRFGYANDGQYPQSALLMDASGNLFGTTSSGGLNAQGTVFELSPSAGGTWTESALYSFGPPGSGDGAYPYSKLVSDPLGNLYGTTSESGGFGTVFKVTPNGRGFIETIIHRFKNEADGSTPYAPVTFDTAGNLYGTTYLGGKYGYGTIFKLTPNSSGAWTESAVHQFTGDADGAYPRYGVLFGPDGQLYGTTPYGGVASAFSGFGVVYEQQP